MDKLTEVVDKYGNMVYRLAISYLKNTHDAQDVVQEVFIKYYNNEGKIQSEEHLKSWLLRVTINLCKNKLMLFYTYHSKSYSSFKITFNFSRPRDKRERTVLSPFPNILAISGVL